MAKSIKPSNLGAAIEQELTIYHRDVTEAVDAAGRKAMKDIVSNTRAKAPKGHRGEFAKSITSKEIKGPRGNRFVWYVKPPNHRLTHLLVHGHATKDGGRTKANPFLQRVLDVVLPFYEETVEKVLRSGK